MSACRATLNLDPYFIRVFYKIGKQGQITRTAQFFEVIAEEMCIYHHRQAMSVVSLDVGIDNIADRSADFSSVSESPP